MPDEDKPVARVYSFRTEYPVDINLFAKTLFEKGHVVLIERLPLWLMGSDGPFFAGEEKVQLTTYLPLEEIQKLMDQQIDAHIMRQTLRELSWNENKFDRDFNV